MKLKSLALGAGLAVDLGRRVTVQATVDASIDGDGAHEGRRVTGLASIMWSTP
mgnify:CR=1 FL=1